MSYWSNTTASELIWRLNGDANNDGTGDANAIKGTANGTWSGSAVYQNQPTGKGNGKAFEFSGSTRIDVGSVTGSPTGSSARTISFWVYVDTFASDNLSAGIFAYSVTGGSGQTFEMYAEDQAISVAFNGHRIISPKTTLVTGTWYHIAVVVPTGSTGTTNTLIYINGVSQSKTNEAGSSQTLNTSTPSIQIGATYNTRYFDGRVYDARIYNTALSQATIQEDVNGPEPTYTSGSITLNEDLTFSNNLVWNDQNNGSVTTTTYREYYNGSAWVTDTDNFNIPVDGRSYRVRIATANNGGNDPNQDQVSNTVVYVDPFIPTYPYGGADYIQPGIEFDWDETKQMAEAHGEILELVESVSLQAFIRRQITEIPEKTRNFDFTNKYKRGY